MSSWRANLRSASFRGARFLLDTSGGTYGRRFADHEYPGRDTPFAEDLGRAQRVWNFTAYVMGDNHHAERDRLIKACEQKGPGELVLPSAPAVQAVCRTCTHGEERARGRIATFTLEFAEAGQLREPNQSTNANSQVEGASDSLGGVSPPAFAGSFSVAGAGPWVANAGVSDARNLTDAMQTLRLPGAGLPQGPLVQAMDYLSSNAESLVAYPQQLAGAIDAAFAGFTEAGEAGPVVGAMLTLATDWRAGNPAGTAGLPLMPELRAQARAGANYPTQRMPSPLQRSRNALAFEGYVHELALREVGYSITGMSFDNYDHAIEVREAVTSVFIAIEEDTADRGQDDIFAALAELRAAITRLIGIRAANLNPLVTYQTPGLANSLTLAWRMYQDADRDLEICDRVAARNPAFLPIAGRILASDQ